MFVRGHSYQSNHYSKLPCVSPNSEIALESCDFIVVVSHSKPCHDPSARDHRPLHCSYSTSSMKLLYHAVTSQVKSRLRDRCTSTADRPTSNPNDESRSGGAANGPATPTANMPSSSRRPGGCSRAGLHGSGRPGDRQPTGSRLRAGRCALLHQDATLPRSRARHPRPCQQRRRRRRRTDDSGNAGTGQKEPLDQADLSITLIPPAANQEEPEFPASVRAEHGPYRSC